MPALIRPAAFIVPSPHANEGGGADPGTRDPRITQFARGGREMVRGRVPGGRSRRQHGVEARRWGRLGGTASVGIEAPIAGIIEDLDCALPPLLWGLKWG